MKPKEHESKHKEPESETKKQRNPSPDQPPPDISILTHSLTGKMLITKDRKQQLADDAFKNSRFILLYFGATNCKGWTSILQNFVRIAADKGVILDVLFVSFDDTEEEFWSYFINEHGNWWAVPYRSELSVLLRYEFDVSSIPYVLLMRPNGEIISRRVVQDLQVKEPEEALTTWTDDELEGVEEEEFLEPPPPIDYSLLDSLEGKVLVNKFHRAEYADNVFADKRIILLYFGASWSEGCEKWPAILKSLKKVSRKTKIPLEILYVPCEYTLEEFWDNFATHGDWWAAPHECELAINLRYEFGVTAIPNIVVMRKNGTILTRNGVKELEDYGLNALATWLPHLRRRSTRVLGTAVPATGAPSSSIATPNIGTRGSLITSSQTSIPRQLETADAFAPPTTSLQAHTTDSVEPQTPDSPGEQTVDPQPLPPTIAKIITKGCVKYARKP